MTSANDKAILNAIFNPLLPVGECIYDENIPHHLKDESSDDESPLSRLVTQLELDGVKAAEAGDVQKALEYFDEAVAKDPLRASCYNNRAQTLRLLSRTEDAMSDLEKALELAKGKGRAACQAHTQRALIHRLRQNDDLAKKDFEAASQLGSEFAKAQLVQMNPYAALCNKMLHDVFSKLQKGESLVN